MKLLAAVMVLVLSSIANAAVLVNVGTKGLTADEIKADYETFNSDQKASINKDQIAKKQLIDNAVNTELLLQAAKKDGLEQDKEFIKARERFERSWLASKYLEKNLDKNLSKSAIKAYFNKHSHIFDTTQVCAEHIVVATAEEANKVAAEVKKSGANFQALAKKYSIDPTVQENHGNLGCFTREQMVPQFSETAFAMKKSEIKGPVATPYGFHVIRVTDIKPGKVPGFDEIEQRVKDTYRIKLIQDTIAELRKKTTVKYNDSEVKDFKL
ncbi:MAG: peptidylprolyl isomerase [Bacteriovoracia bacterium]